MVLACISSDNLCQDFLEAIKICEVKNSLFMEWMQKDIYSFAVMWINHLKYERFFVYMAAVYYHEVSVWFHQHVCEGEKVDFVENPLSLGDMD